LLFALMLLQEVERETGKSLQESTGALRP
jgi:hypothetical protein